MIVLNYKKQGLFQIFPILFVKNGEEKVLMIGFGNKNIAYIFNPLEKTKTNELDKYKRGGEVELNPTINSYKKLTVNEKVLIIAGLGSLACLCYFLAKKMKK